MAQEEINFTDFIASSIHDMKNSLNIQVSSLETIAHECRQRGDQDTFEKLGLMIYEANRMNANLIQLLSLYKFGQSTYPMDIAEQSVADVIDEAMLQNRTLMEFKGLQVVVDCDADCYWYIDRDLVTGILVNALNNAYKYTHTRIRVAAHVVNQMLESGWRTMVAATPPTCCTTAPSWPTRASIFTAAAPDWAFTSPPRPLPCTRTARARAP